MKTFALIVLLFSTFTVFSQIEYEKGYLINDQEEKVQCLIYNKEWMNNPSEIKYKLSEEGETVTGPVEAIKEFGVGGMRYVRAKAKIDTSIQNLKRLNYNRHPEWRTKVVFLKMLVDGKADLYKYKEGDIEKFFFSVDNGPVEQLVYKQFLRSATVSDYNLTYLQQLKVQVSCKQRSDAAMREIRYEQTSLERYFREYNQCTGTSSEPTLTTARKRNRLRFAVVPGIEFQNFLVRTGSGFTLPYNKGANLRLGVNIESLLPFNKRKWSVMLEPTWQQYSDGSDVSYQSLELAAGPRHYFYLGNQMQIFANALVVTDLPIKYKVNFLGSDYESNNPSLSLAAGLGFGIKRVSIEARRYFTRSTIGYNASQFLVYDKYSMLFAYRFN